MDIGRFKATRTRLVMWLMLPPLLIAGIGLSSYAVRLKSEWELTRTEGLTSVLPKLVRVRKQAFHLVDEFEENSLTLHSEDDLIVYLRKAAQASGFDVDALKVNRKKDKVMTILTASLTGTGSFESIQRFLGNVSAGQHLLSERELQLTRVFQSGGAPAYKADLTLSLAMFDTGTHEERTLQ